MRRRRRYVYQLGADMFLLSDTTPKRLTPAEADKMLRHAVFARALGRKGGVGLTKDERVARAKAAAAARWGKRQKDGAP